MKFLIENYIRNLTKEDINNFALKNAIYLNNNELDFTYSFIKNNYQKILNNPEAFDYRKYKERYSSANYEKIITLIKKYSVYLN